ncbi:hypothetical protein JCM8097_009144 [Rhodosporidiobolus ruineniae]
MVAHLSYKLSHIAQTLRPSHLTSAVRNAFPSSATGASTSAPAPAFDFTSNVFGHASNVASSVGANGTTALGMAAGAFGAGAGVAAGQGSGAAGGAGTGSSQAGSWSSWGFHSTKSLHQGPASQNDSQLDNTDEDLRAFASPTARRSLLRRRSPVSFTSRSSGLSPSSPPRPSPSDLLRADEAGLSSVRLGGAEMQRMYHTAVAKGDQPTAESAREEAEREADEVDLGVAPTGVLSSGRRASISLSALKTSRSSPLVTSTGLSTPARPAVRALHTSAASASPAPSPSPASSSRPSVSPAPVSSAPVAPSTPPTATLPLVRRNSTSAVPSSTNFSHSAAELPRSATPPPRSSAPAPAGDAALRSKKFKIGRAKAMQQKRQEAAEKTPEETQQQQDRRNAILAAERERNPRGVRHAIRQYLADPSTWMTSTHNAAMSALHTTRPPNEPLDAIIELYNQLFSTPGLHPTRLSYEIILRAFCVRDNEVRNSIEYIDKRKKKKVLAGEARGSWNTLHREDGTAQIELDNERNRRKELESENYNYYNSALKLFEALGPLGDRLSNVVVQMLMGQAVDHGDVDVALALFERLEKSPHQSPSYRAYGHLIRMYGTVEKDAALVKEVFEAYLDGRAQGWLQDPGARSGPLTRARYRSQSIKHRYDTEPEYVLDQTDRTRFDVSASNDEYIWCETIQALFEAGDAAGGVELIERMLAVTNATETDAATPGYPSSLAPRSLASVVTGFARNGDESSARTWLRRVLELTPGPWHSSYYAAVLYAAIDLRAVGLVNDVYRVMLDTASKENPLMVSDFVSVLDCNLAATWSSTATADEKRTALDAVAEFRSIWAEKSKAGLLSSHVGDYSASTGLLQRIAIAEGVNSIFDRAVATALELANLVRAYMREIPEDDAAARAAGYRPRVIWALKVDEAAFAAVGLVRTGSKMRDLELRRAGEPLPPVHLVAKITGFVNKLHRVVDWIPEAILELAVVQAYLASRAAAPNGQVQLSGDEWFTVLEAFAHVGSLLRRSTLPGSSIPSMDNLPFEFPGFDLAYNDFIASGAEIPVGHGLYDYNLLARKLKESGYRYDEIRSIVEIMARNVLLEPEVFEPLKEGAEQLPAAAVEDDTASLASGSVAPATSATDVSARSTADASEPPQQFPTPPSTPPSYFAELAPAPPAAPPLTQYDLALGAQIEQLVYSGTSPHGNANATRTSQEAFRLALSAAQQGRFAHPDAYGRLVEQLGRQHLVHEVRQVYLVAYEALNAMAAEPEAQSAAWVALEDRMIVALAQAGELVDVGHHRDRLLEAGCAPSADAYAAMILNMKDTTDDAAVALTLFEESQRLGVAPNVYLFNTLISKLSRARRAKESLEYFELMKQHGLTPSSITYGAIINACCKTGDDVSADYLFREMVTRPDFKPRVPPYNTMLQFYTSTKPDRQRALHYYDELVKARVPPTAHTYKLLLDTYGSTGDVPDLESMRKVFDRLVRDKHVKVSGAHWASMITAYGIGAKDAERAVALFDSIPAHPSTAHNPNGPLPDAVVYEALLNALIANGRAELCDKYLEEMRDKGVRMTAYVANTLIKGYTALSLFPAARRIFAAMAEPASGVASAGNHPIDRHPKHHHLASRAGAGAGNGAEAPTYREPSTYEAMILAELKAGEVGRAAEVLRLAEARAFPPAVIGRLKKLLSDAGIEALPLSQ